MNQRSLVVALTLGMALIAATPTQRPPRAEAGPSHSAVVSEPTDTDLFLTSDRCIACHKGVSTDDGEDVSIGYDWRASMMANSARDPYWHAAVRREIMDYPEATEAIEDKCSRCHMPMANEVARIRGGTGSVFANLPHSQTDEGLPDLAADGVGCAVCHQVLPDGLGTEATFTGGFVIAAYSPPEGRPIFGPFEPDEAGQGIMHSATGFRPTEASHIQTSELCASCHTLFTHAVKPDGATGPEFPEQAPYLEWQASRYAAEGETCQDCHMPEVGEHVPVTAVLGRDRPEVSRHVFRGGNFFMIRMLNRYRGELGVTALPQEMSLAAARTEDHLRSATARVALSDVSREGARVRFDVAVRNLAGHKFPTAYPSRRAWLHVTVRDDDDRTVFESGAFSPSGRIVGNDNDDDGTRYEPHYDEITDPDQVQVYEAVMVDGAGAVTTGLMSAERLVKDNRLLPEGFDRRNADGRVVIQGAASSDASFEAGGDDVSYDVRVEASSGPLTVSVELMFQPIAYRWAHNLGEYDSFETDRFVRYYESMSDASAIVVAIAAESVR